MILSTTTLKDLYTVETEIYKDGRGEFNRIFDKKDFIESIPDLPEFIQINRSFNSRKGTIRGLHYQIPPSAEHKLVTCVEGSIFDVAVDLRKGSETFLKWFGIILSRSNCKSLFIPRGFAHGFQTLEDNSTIIYHHTGEYDKANERGINYLDKKINVVWPETITEISPKDHDYPIISSNYEGLII